MGKRVKKVEKMIKDFKRTQTQTKNKYNLDNKKGNSQPADDKKKDIMYGILMDQISKIDTELSDITSKMKEEERWLSNLSPNAKDPIQQEIKEKHEQSLERLKKEQERKTEENEKLRKQLRENKTKKEMRDEIGKINSEISVIDLRITKYQEELAKTSPSEKDLVAEYLKNIQKLEDQKNSKEMLARQEEKEKLETQLKQREKLEKEEIEKALTEQEEEIRSKLAKEKGEIEEDIRNIELQRDKVDINMKSIMRQMKNFEYKYEDYNYEVTEKDENGNKVTKQRTSRRIANTEEYEKLNADYQKGLDSFMSLKETLEDLQEARDLCDKEMDKFRQKDQEKMEKFSKALNDAKRDEEKRKEEEKQDKKEKQDRKKEEKPAKKEEEQEKEKKEKPTDEEHTENDSEEIETKWHPELTPEQIDDLKAEGIEPGDQEYDAYLRNHGIKVKQEKKKPEEKKPEEKKSKWHPELTQEQIDDLKAEGIEPGDQEYNMYLRNLGIRLDSQKRNQEPKSQGTENQEPKNQEPQNGGAENQESQNGKPQNQGNAPKVDLPANCSIRIGRNATIEYDGKIYQVSKKDIKNGLKVSAYNDRKLKRYIRNELGLPKELRKNFMQLVRDGYLDMTVVYAIYSTDLEENQKKEIIGRQITKIHRFREGQKYQGNEIDIKYDMDDLSKASLWDRIRRKEVNEKQKIQLCKNAARAERWGLGEVQGQYNPPARTLKEKFFAWRNKNKMKALPMRDKNALHEIALEYNKMAYDKDGNKRTKREVKSKYNEFKDRVKIDDKKLSVEQQQAWRELRQLVNAHTSPVSATKAEEKPDNQKDDDGSR